MKTRSQISLLMLTMAVVFTGCDAANDAADAANKAKDAVGDMANMDFGDFDMKGLQEKFTGITDGLKDVSAENVDGLSSKISDLSGSMDGLGIDSLTGPVKTAVMGAVSKFGDTVKAAMEGISDEGILGKLKPAVEGLMEKINAMK